MKSRTFLIVFLFPALTLIAAEPPLPKPLPASQYVAPKDRSLEMQAFDKAVLYLSAQQEEDGHWDAKKSGASGDFAGVNGDIASTALATYALLCCAQGKLQNRDAMLRAKRGLEWLRAKLQPDGRVADLSAPEPVLTQMTCAMAFLQSASMSTRNVLREAAVATTRYAIMKMTAKPGGYGATPQGEAARADITAVASFVFRSARMEDVKFDETNPRYDSEIEGGIKNGLKTLLVNPDLKSGIFSMSGSDLKPDWDATVGGALTQVLLLAPPSVLSGALKFILTDEEKTTSTYPGLKEKFGWGKDGDGYRALTLWQGSLSIIYLYQEHTKQWKAWTGIARPILLERQLPDGSWDVGGEDAKRGKVWRASLHAMSLILLAPAPPPPSLPPDPQPPDNNPPK